MNYTGSKPVTVYELSKMKNSYKENWNSLQSQPGYRARCTNISMRVLVLIFFNFAGPGFLNFL